MKKWICLGLAVALAVAGCGCAKTAATSTAAGNAASSQTSADNTVSSTVASSVAVSESSAPVAQADADLTAILQEIVDRYEPGTAGCSLKSAALAGKLLDWQAKTSPTADTVKATVSAFTETMDADAKTAFVEKMDDVMYTAGDLLTSENAQELLEEAGFTAERFPWDAAAGQSFVDEMNAAVKA